MNKMILPAAILIAVTGCATDAQRTGPATASVEPVLATGETILGQPIVYPTATASVTAVIVTLPPGASTGWHHHDVPLFGYLLEGELTVTRAPVDAFINLEKH